ncbi:MAG: acyltransferase [Lachnospiraceae bacterium]|nr:acyltransferase [Lachnospiraceae bacterium]
MDEKRIETVPERDTVSENEKKAAGMPYKPAVKRLRLLLMFFLCIDLFGFPIIISSLAEASVYVQKVCGFVPLAFYIISGYLVLRDDEDRSARILRTIKRSAIVFGVMTVAYLIVNYAYYTLLGAGNEMLVSLTNLRGWFNFLVLNVWQYDIGNSIWFVQGILYAYVIIYFLDKWKLLKYDWLISLLFILAAVATGELSGLLNFNILGYEFIPGNFLTRALPYLLLGRCIHRNIHRFTKVKKWVWLIAGLVGVVLVVGEIYLLNLSGAVGYYGHLIGMLVIAVCLCVPAFLKRGSAEGIERKLKMTRQDINVIYYICEAVYAAATVGLGLFMGAVGQYEYFPLVFTWIGVITFVVSFLIAWLISWLKRVARSGKVKAK